MDINLGNITNATRSATNAMRGATNAGVSLQPGTLFPEDKDPIGTVFVLLFLGACAAIPIFLHKFKTPDFKGCSGCPN